MGKHVRPGYGYEPNFRLTGKLNVNGASESPVFTLLKARCPTPFGLIANRTDITWTPIRNNDISWNFAKWLVDHEGQPYKRYTSRTVPENLEDDITYLIDKCKKATDAKRPGQATQQQQMPQQQSQQQQQQQQQMQQPQQQMQQYQQQQQQPQQFQSQMPQQQAIEIPEMKASVSDKQPSPAAAAAPATPEKVPATAEKA